MYIAFEGVDTSGKTTQAKLLHESLKGSILTKEPGGTKIGQEIREMVLHKGVSSHITELFLFLADRSEHYKCVIEPNLEKVVISDRSLVSGIAYAMANHKEYKMEFLEELNRFALKDHLPTHLILLKTDRELILKRLGEKNEDKIEKRGVEYLLRVQEYMIESVERMNINSLIIDASLDIETIHNKIEGFIDD
jgi:dTMP kinase